MKSYISPATATAIHNRLLALAVAIGMPVLCVVVAAMLVLLFTILALVIVAIMLSCVVTGKEPDVALGRVSDKLDKWKIGRERDETL